jgi:hypothetical protein
MHPRHLALLTLLTLSPALSPALNAQQPEAISRTPRNAGGRPVHNEAERAARWRTVQIPYNAAALTARQRQMVARLADACRLMDILFWHQSDLGGYHLYHTTQSEILRRLFAINGDRWDLLDEHFPILGEQPYIPGHELYPYGLTRAAIEQYALAHPDQKADLYSPRTVIRTAPFTLSPLLSQPVVSPKEVPATLLTVPYHVAYAEWLVPMAADLRAAARLSPDPAFARYLTLRAEALLTDDYFASEVAWLELKDPAIDLIFGPNEGSLDDVLAVKNVYGASILIRNDRESRKLALYREHEAEMQQALPIEAAARPSKAGFATPMEVADAPLRAGSLRYGYQAVADNLPDDPRVHAEKGSKKIFFKNFMDLRVANVVLPIGAMLLPPDQAAKVTANGYLTPVILHEISHGLGPAYSTVSGKQIPINAAIGPAYAGLEEAKADVTGVFLAHWLVEQKLIPAADLETIYASFVAGIFRTLRFGTGEAHGRAQMMEFNYLLEHHTLTESNGRYTIDFAAMPATITALCHQLLTFEHEGDRAGADAWFARYDVMPAHLTHALDRTSAIPVDVTPDFELSRGVRP